MQIVSQLCGGRDDGELEGNISPRTKAMAWPLTRLIDRRSVALAAHVQCSFFGAGKARLTCTRKVVTRIADRRS